MKTKPIARGSKPHIRRASASIELVLATAIALPLALLLLILGSKMLTFTFGATGGLVTMPWL